MVDCISKYLYTVFVANVLSLKNKEKICKLPWIGNWFKLKGVEIHSSYLTSWIILLKIIILKIACATNLPKRAKDTLPLTTLGNNVLIQAAKIFFL